MPELRFDPLRREWVAFATERNDRTFLPTDFCPLCPSGRGGRSEVPLDTFEVVVFENRFPAFGPDRLGDRPVRPATTGCEVVVLADYTKIGQETMCQTVPAARVHTLITDSRATPVELEAIRAAGVDVRVARVGENDKLQSAAS